MTSSHMLVEVALPCGSEVAYGTCKRPIAGMCAQVAGQLAAVEKILSTVFTLE